MSNSPNKTSAARKTVRAGAGRRWLIWLLIIVFWVIYYWWNGSP